MIKFLTLNLFLYFSLIKGFARNSESKSSILIPEIERPNFIIILADDMGYGDIGCYGNANIKTPNLDKLANEGVRFMDFHSNGAVCSPTRAALLTGKYQQRTGIIGVITAKSHRDVGLPLSENTIAEVLKREGYITGVFGKWHLGYSKKYNPIHQGFDEFIGFVSGNIDYHSHVDQEGFYDWWREDELINQRGYTTDLITDNAIDFIQRNKDNPFFLYVAHEAPHSPYQNRESKADRCPGGLPDVDFPVWGSEKDIPSLYKDMVEILDENVGKTMDFFPTILELANVESYSESDGVSIAQHLLHSKPLSARTLFWQHGEQYAVRKGKWKLIVSGNHEKPELYNLKEDMEEKINVSHEYPDILNELLDELKEWQKNVFEGVKIFS